MSQSDSKKQQPDFAFEQRYINASLTPVAGVDEAGRGPWAGPVVAGAVILDPDNIPAGLNDSKKLNPARREELFDKIIATSQVGIGIIEAGEIDQINILQATMKAMADAIDNLKTLPAVALIDGNRSPKLVCNSETIKKGDARSLSIAAGSIIAKVTRDRMMFELDKKYPGYEFSRHKGYGTAIHAKALEKLGPCPEHRKTFAPIRALLDDSK